MRNAKCVSEAMEVLLPARRSFNAAAGPSRPRRLSTSSALGANGRQYGQARTGFGIKKAPREDVQINDANFGFGIPKAAAPGQASDSRRTDRARVVKPKPKPSPVVLPRAESAEIGPALLGTISTDASMEDIDKVELTKPHNGLTRREYSDLSWIRVHFSAASMTEEDGAEASSSKSKPKPSQKYHPDLPDFANTFSSPDKIHHLDQYLAPLAIALTVPSALVATLKPETEERITRLLGLIWIRANELKRVQILGDNIALSGKRIPAQGRSGKDKYRAEKEVPAATAAKCYARFVVARALRPAALLDGVEEEFEPAQQRSDKEQAILLLERLESDIRRWRDTTRQFQLPAPIFAAWAMLRSRAGVQADAKPGEGLRVVPPAMTKLDPVLRELAGLASTDGIVDEAKMAQYQEALQGLVDVTAGDRSLPVSLDELDSTLADIRVKRETERAIVLWEQWRTAATTKPSQAEWSGGLLDPDPTTRTAVLLSFFRFFARNPRLRKPTVDEERLGARREEVVALFPKPWSSEVHHAILRFYAKMDEGDLPTAEEAKALEDEVVGSSSALASAHGEKEGDDRLARNRDDRLRQLKAAWRAAEADYAVDLKMYMLYVEGLGRLGDAQEIKAVWKRLVKDDRTRDLYRKAEGAKAIFPPTNALNHIISSALLIRDSGPEVALELFHGSATPDSSVKCNVVTINTILRHYATTRNVDGLTATVGLAEKLGLVPDVVTYTTLLQGLLRSGEIELAKRTMENMSLQGVRPNEHTAGLLISDLVRKGDRAGLLAAEDLMKEMKLLGMNVGIVPWTSLIGGYYRGGWLADAKSARARMKLNGIHLNRVGYNMLLREAGRIPSAARAPIAPRNAPHSRWMRDERAPLANALADSKAFRNAQGAQDAYRQSTERMAQTMVGLYQEMEAATPRVEANADTYTIMLQALASHARWEEAEWVLGKMRENGYTAEKANLRTWVRRVEAWMAEKTKREMSRRSGYKS